MRLLELREWESLGMAGPNDRFAMLSEPRVHVNINSCPLLERRRVRLDMLQRSSTFLGQVILFARSERVELCEIPVARAKDADVRSWKI